MKSPSIAPYWSVCLPTLKTWLRRGSQTTIDTDIHLFNSSLTIIDDGSNDDESVAEGGLGTALQSQLRRNLTAGTYYLAIGRYNIGTNDNSPGSDDFRTGNVLDFPNLIACSTSTTVTTGGTDFDMTITDSTGTPVPVTVLGTANTPYEVVFVQFTVADPAPAFTAFCFGDGTGAACPCANNGTAGNGCANSINANGANLTATGSASIANDTFALQGSGMPNSNALYFQGTTQTAVAFGDGLRCAGGTIVRLGTKLNAAGSSAYPGSGEASVSVRGLIVAPGTRTYQVWYRNALGPCGSGSNLTNAVAVIWTP